MKIRAMITIFLVSVILMLPTKARSQCEGTIDSNLNINLPRADFGGIKLSVVLGRYNNPQDTDNLYFRLTDAAVVQDGEICASITQDLMINVICADYLGTRFYLTLTPFRNLVDPDWLYWVLTGGGLYTQGANQKPVANPISLNIDPTIPYVEQHLSAFDPDGDTIAYELASPLSGAGYQLAYVNRTSGMLYLTLQSDGTNPVTINYRVTDGQLFSDTASVTLTINFSDERDTGSNDVDASTYNAFDFSTFSSDLMGGSRFGDTPQQPPSVDLSLNFPEPGNQGNQSSCVGWATAYALKSYQEKVEIGWSLNTAEHLFSPAFLYNQINGGQDKGSYIHEALQLVVDKGLATLDKMPYSPTDYLTQPGQDAVQQALNYRARSWTKINDTSQIKAALVNRKPLVIGIPIYQNFYNLKGADAVYNTTSGNNDGGHAVTIVGYDDNRFGGAFKVINSWGINWGDGGYFWMPYNFAQQVISQAYVLEDKENGSNPTPTEPTEPEPQDSSLPNLIVQSWSASYEPRPGGAGELTYKIANNGTGNAPAGADVNFMLSDNPGFTANDYYVVYETIPFDLAPGEVASRDDANKLSFLFPDEITPGTYYMALWVDDLDAVAESNEDDNISPGERPLQFEQANLPDLTVRNWGAQWDGYGYGTLTYEVVNSGTAPTTNMDWYINLILDADATPGNGNEIFLFYEKTQFILDPNGYIYRDYNNPQSFYLYTDYEGNPVPDGYYYMALWVDDTGALAESNENNNGSYDWGLKEVYSWNQWGAAPSTTTRSRETGSFEAHNGKSLPAHALVRRVRIGSGSDGIKTVELLDEEEPISAAVSLRKGSGAQRMGVVKAGSFSKINSSRAGAILPVKKMLSMPSQEKEVQ